MLTNQIDAIHTMSSFLSVSMVYQFTPRTPSLLFEVHSSRLAATSGVAWNQVTGVFIHALLETTASVIDESSVDNLLAAFSEQLIDHETIFHLN